MSCGNEQININPSDLLKAQAESELVQKGFYDVNALEISNKYPHTRPENYALRPLDHRLATNAHMLGNPNAAVAVNAELLAEIKHSMHLREYERGLRPDPPAPKSVPKPVFSIQAKPHHSHHDTEQEIFGAQAKLKDKSTSSFPQGAGTNRTTVPSQFGGN